MRTGRGAEPGGARRVAARIIVNKTALDDMAQEPPMLPVKNSPRARVLLSAICLPEVDLLSRPKDGPLPGRYI